VNVYGVSEQSAGAEGQFSIQAPLPRVDVIVRDQTRIAVVHDVDTSNGPSEVTIDMAEAPTIVTGRYTFDPPDSDETLGDVDLFSTENFSQINLAFGAGEYGIPDSSVVATGDQMNIDLLAFSKTSGRSVGQGHVAPSTTFATHWLPRITGTIDPARTAATFDQYNIDDDSLGISCSAAGSRESVSITRGYRDLRADELEFTEDVPGWRWAISADKRSCGGTVYRWLDANSYADTYFQVNSATPASAAPSDSNSHGPSRPARARTRK